MEPLGAPLPGRRLGRGASLYLGLVWLLAPLVLMLWVLPSGDEGGDVAARYIVAQRLGPLLVGFGEAMRAAAALMGLAAGDARQRPLAHVGVLTTVVLVAMAIAPGPWLGLLALLALMIRQAAAAQLLREPAAWLAALGCLAFGVACEVGDTTTILVAFGTLAALVVLAEILHTLARRP